MFLIRTTRIDNGYTLTRLSTKHEWNYFQASGGLEVDARLFFYDLFECCRHLFGVYVVCD